MLAVVFGLRMKKQFVGHTPHSDCCGRRSRSVSGQTVSVHHRRSTVRDVSTISSTVYLMLRIIKSSLSVNASTLMCL